MAEWSQRLLRLMNLGISAFVVVFLLCRHPGEKKRDSVQTVAEISGGTAISTRCREKPIMNISALAVKSRLQPMAIRTESIVPMSAT